MKKKFKIRYKRLFIFLIIILIIILLGICIFNLRISNIYVNGNEYLSDQDILELCEIENYPRAITTLSNVLENRLLASDLIKNVHIKKKFLTHIYIDVSENRPIVYDEINKKTILEDGKSIDYVFDVPILVNSIDANVYSKFLVKMIDIDLDVLSNISEIEYTPAPVDNELFMFLMKDGNYISVNLNKFSSVNRYLEIVKKFDNKKGILYLDSGEYFKILGN